MYEEGATPLCRNLPADLGGFIAVAEVSHCNMCSVIGKDARDHRAETAACTSSQGDPISKIHRDASSVASTIVR